tara:strand:+ start:972 stop:1814 length:843 start_codon:yes stop_codon:yes gene_type:complete
MDFTKRNIVIKKIEPQDFKNLLASLIEPYDNYTIMLSAGIDSRSLVFESLEQNKTFNCCTFRMDNIESKDYLEAKALCDYYNLELIDIKLPSDVSVLEKDIYDLKLLGCNSKTDFECFWPFYYAYKEIKNDTLMTGLAADGHFCLSKKGMIHFKDTRIDEFRTTYFDKPNAAQRQIHLDYCKGINKTHVMPFLEQEMVDLFLGTSWDDLNKPFQKSIIVYAYKEYFDKVKVYKHTNLQKGDSGISDHFEKLLDTTLNTNKFKSVISIFNRLPSKRVKRLF